MEWQGHKSFSQYSLAWAALCTHGIQFFNTSVLHGLSNKRRPRENFLHPTREPYFWNSWSLVKNRLLNLFCWFQVTLGERLTRGKGRSGKCTTSKTLFLFFCDCLCPAHRCRCILYVVTCSNERKKKPHKSTHWVSLPVFYWRHKPWLCFRNETSWGSAFIVDPVKKKKKMHA